MRLRGPCTFYRKVHAFSGACQSGCSDRPTMSAIGRRSMSRDPTTHCEYFSQSMRKIFTLYIDKTVWLFIMRALPHKSIRSDNVSRKLLAMNKAMEGMPHMQCSNCKYPIYPYSKCCPSCGREVQTQNASSTTKTKPPSTRWDFWVAGLRKSVILNKERRPA